MAKAYVLRIGGMDAASVLCWTKEDLIARTKDRLFGDEDFASAEQDLWARDLHILETEGCLEFEDGGITWTQVEVDLPAHVAKMQKECRMWASVADGEKASRLELEVVFRAAIQLVAGAKTNIAEGSFVPVSDMKRLMAAIDGVSRRPEITPSTAVKAFPDRPDTPDVEARFDFIGRLGDVDVYQGYRRGVAFVRVEHAWGSDVLSLQALRLWKGVLDPDPRITWQDVRDLVLRTPGSGLV